MNVVVVDDHPLIHLTMSAIARAAIPQADVYSEMGLREGIARTLALGRPRLTLLDLGLPGCCGIEALTHFQAALPDTPVIVISVTEEQRTMHAAFRAGAAGYLPKTLPPDSMVAGIKCVVAGGVYMPPSLAYLIESPPAPADAPLTGRQVEIMQMVSEGKSNRAIAVRLSISEGTVKQHLFAVFKALRVGTRAQAVLKLARNTIGAAPAAK